MFSKAVPDCVASECVLQIMDFYEKVEFTVLYLSYVKLLQNLMLVVLGKKTALWL